MKGDKRDPKIDPRSLWVGQTKNVRYIKKWDDMDEQYPICIRNRPRLRHFFSWPWNGNRAVSQLHLAVYLLIPSFCLCVFISIFFLSQFCILLKVSLRWWCMLTLFSSLSLSLSDLIPSNLKKIRKFSLTIHSIKRSTFSLMSLSTFPTQHAHNYQAQNRLYSVPIRKKKY